jgi:DNA-binding transcriptional ArsR family regulator
MTEWDDAPVEAEEGEVGYRSPPKATRFKKGQSGNPAGRPRGRHREAPYEAVLGQIVTIREGGTTRRGTAAEAFLLKLTKSGLEGDSAAARDILDVIAKAKDQQGGSEPPVTEIVRRIVVPGSVTYALLPLRMAKKLDPYRETARMLLAPWLVERALARLGRTLSPVEQRTVVEVTRTPHKVRWPEWWSEYP